MSTPPPNLLDRLIQNAPGAYYVDATCTDCDLCRSLAPGFFSRHDETGYSFVHRQPVTPHEIEQAEEALIGCPTESIGRDGVIAGAPVSAKP